MAVAQDQDKITVQEAAKRYNVTPTTVYAWITSGRIRKFQRELDKRIFVSKQDIDQLQEIHPVEDEKQGNS